MLPSSTSPSPWSPRRERRRRIRHPPSLTRWPRRPAAFVVLAIALVVLFLNPSGTQSASVPRGHDERQIEPTRPHPQVEAQPGKTPPSLPPFRLPDSDPLDHNPAGRQPSFLTEPHFAPVDFLVHHAHPAVPAILTPHNLYLAPVTVKPASMQIWQYLGGSKDAFDLVWMNDDQGLGSGAFNLHPVDWYGKPHLLLWSGKFQRWPGYGEGFYVLLDESYNVVFNISLPDPVDFHDASLTPEHTLISTVWRKLGPFDHSKYNGSQEDGAIFDAAFAEYSPKTGEPIFGWSPYEAGLPLSLTHIPGKKTFVSSKPWDWAHTNSVSKDRLGNYLVSLRSLHTLFYIDGRTKETLWTLGGPNSNFTGDGNNFSWQHNALWLEEDEHLGLWTLDEIRAASEGRPISTTQAQPGKLNLRNRRLSLYDNGALSARARDRNESRGLILELDMGRKTARIVQVYEKPGRNMRPPFRSISSTSQGNLQILPPFKPWAGQTNGGGSSNRISSSHLASFSKPGSTPVLLAYGMKPYLALYERSGTPLWLCEYRAPSNSLFHNPSLGAVGGPPVQPPKPLLGAGRGTNVDSYRSYLGPRWRGKPRWPLKIVLSADRSTLAAQHDKSDDDDGDEDVSVRMAWISWNGAAGVREYRVLDPSVPSSSTGAGAASRRSIPRTGFETRVDLGPTLLGMHSIVVEAYDACGHRLLRSPPLVVTPNEGLLEPAKGASGKGAEWLYGWSTDTDRCPLPT
ncbi:hypothetical protein OC844_002251 [Tilletia horrida]|nr:hypothetical protein OC844_002251 [Tilletia horrida]